MPAEAVIVLQNAEQASGSGQATPASSVGARAQGSTASQQNEHGKQWCQPGNLPVGVDGGSPFAAKHFAAVPKRRRREPNPLDGTGVRACSVNPFILLCMIVTNAQIGRSGMQAIVLFNIADWQVLEGQHAS